MLKVIQFIGDTGKSTTEEWDVLPETLTKLRAVAVLIPDNLKILSVSLVD